MSIIKTITGNNASRLPTSIEPWLSVKNSARAVEFYKAAFGATEVYKLDTGDGVVCRLSVEGAQFWVSEAESDDSTSTNNRVRMILIVQEPDALFAHAIAAGGIEIFPVGEDFGWRLGRLQDPFGLHWEIGHMLDEVAL